ncbi:Uncharacterised protein [Candidatus Tiddalikarchaeum anstoanum]|nr:Uncharacterised protein [Candidatus Tiddalikarchaeum anstoanum]
MGLEDKINNDITHSTIPGAIRLVIDIKYLAMGNDDMPGNLDIHFKNLIEYKNNVETKLKPMHRTILFRELQEYFLNTYHLEWDAYLKAYQGKILETLKYENNKIVKYTEKAEQDLASIALYAAHNRIKQLDDKKMQEIIDSSKLVLDSFWDDKIKTDLEKKLGTEFTKLKTQIESYAFLADSLAAAQNKKDENKIRKVVGEIKNFIKDTLEKYAPLKEIILIKRPDFEELIK